MELLGFINLQNRNRIKQNQLCYAEKYPTVAGTTPEHPTNSPDTSNKLNMLTSGEIISNSLCLMGGGGGDD